MSTCFSLQPPIRVSPPPQTLKTLITPNSPPFGVLHPTKKFGRTRIGVSEADPITAVPPSPPSSPDLSPAADVVRGFYGGINRRDLDSVGLLIAERCVYEDLVFSRPFVGRKDILTFFTKFSDSISSDLQFVIDDISCEDSSAIGVTWHLEWRGKPFPFSKGCSFYRLEVIDGKRQIILNSPINAVMDEIAWNQLLNLGILHCYWMPDATNFNFVEVVYPALREYTGSDSSRNLATAEIPKACRSSLKLPTFSNHRVDTEPKIRRFSCTTGPSSSTIAY